MEALGKIEFNITQHVLDIVYSQTICWLSLFVAPLMSAVTLLKFFAIAYLRMFFVKYVSAYHSAGIL